MQSPIDWTKIILAIISLIGAITPLWFTYKLKQEEKRKQEEQIERGEKPKPDVRTESIIKKLSILMYVCIIVLVSMLGLIVYDRFIKPPEIITPTEETTEETPTEETTTVEPTEETTPVEPTEETTPEETTEKPVEDVTLDAEDSRSGYISGPEDAEDVFSSGTIVHFGDSDSDEEVKGYLSFDISDISNISDVTITDADITITGVGYIGEPWLAGDEIRIKVFPYGGSLSLDDYAVGGEPVKTFNTSATLNNLSFSTNTLKNSLQNAVDDGKSRFQLKFGLSGISFNSYSDVYKFESNNASLHIEYEYYE